MSDETRWTRDKDNENKRQVARQGWPVCPSCEEGRGQYEGRVLIDGRGVYTCDKCGARWQDLDEKPSNKGIPISHFKEG